MAVNFDEKLAQRAVEGVVSLANGDFVDKIQNLYGSVSKLGEENEVVETPKRALRAIEQYFNDQCVPALNKVIQNCEGFEALSIYVKQQLQGATVAQGEDVGQVADATYDAARNL